MRGDLTLVTPRGERFDLFGVAGTRKETEPWTYPRTHPAYGTRPYTLVFHGGGFKHRVYDWEGRLVRASERTQPAPAPGQKDALDA